MLESLLNTYGYPLILAGTFLEGETILVLGGVSAHMGYLSIGWVITCGFVGTLFGDQLYYYLGRRHGTGFLEKRPAWHSRAQRVHRILERYPVLLLLGFRFLYGLRTVTPFVVGTSKVSWPVYSLLNFIGAFVWALAVGLAGYYFGRGIEAVLGEIRHYELELLTFIGIAGALAWSVHFIVRRNSKRRTPDKSDS